MHKRNESGFAFVLEIALVAVVLVVVAIVAAKVLSKKSPGNPLTTAVNKLTGSSGGKDPWGEPCHIKETGKRMLTVAPIKIEDLDVNSPMGLMTGGHVTPIDHMYFYPKPTPGNRFSAEVRAMADGHITSIQHRGDLVDGPANARPGSDEFRMTIEQTCNQGYYYDLITKLAPNLQDKVQGLTGGGSKGVDIPIKAGDLIGYVGNQSLDFGVYDTTVNLGFIVPAHYTAEPWKIHTADAYKYFSADLLKSLDAKITRKVEPRAGKIDYDKDGYLVGNWFEKGTNGYGGPAGHPTPDYFKGHLAMAYDAIDPTRIIISIGFLVGSGGGQGGQYNVAGNSPDPATVTQASGLVKYSLTSGNGPDGMGNQVPAGTLLVQLTAKRELKLEYFAYKTPAQVSAFTSAAKTYER